MISDKITLTRATGYDVADHVLQEIVTRFETAFPSRVVGYYVEGSYADGTAIPTSDLGLIIVFNAQFAPEEEAAATHLVDVLEAESAIELDVSLIDEATLQQNANPMFKLSSQLVYGQNIRESIPLMPIELWARQRMHAAYWLMINVFGRPKPMRAPLAFPKPDDPYYGYANRTMPMAESQEVPTTRNLIRVTGWIATARLAYEAQEYVVRKRECYLTYQRSIGDEWTALLAQIDQRCRTDWHYRIPDSEPEQRELRNILQQTLGYENHFLTVYRHFLLAEFACLDNDAKLAALNFLNQIVYDDPKVIQAVREATTAQNAEVRSIAEEVANKMSTRCREKDR